MKGSYQGGGKLAPGEECKHTSRAHCKLDTVAIHNARMVHFGAKKTSFQPTLMDQTDGGYLHEGVLLVHSAYTT